jgi:hypothetical protein
MSDNASRSIGLRVIACSAACVLLSLGLCKLGFYLARDIHDGAPPDLDILGGIGFVLSVLGIAVGILIAILETVARRRRDPSPAPPIDNGDEQNRGR